MIATFHRYGFLSLLCIAVWGADAPLDALGKGVRALIALGTDNSELISVGGGSGDHQSGLVIQSIAFGDYRMSYRTDTGNVIMISVPDPVWSNSQAAIASSKLVQDELHRWDILRHLGYPANLRFDGMAASIHELRFRLVVRDRVCKFGRFFDERVSYGFATDEKGEKVRLVSVMINASSIDADALAFRDIAAQTTEDDVRKAWENVKDMEAFKMLSIVWEQVKIEQELFLLHENDFFRGKIGGFQTNLVAPIRRARSVMFTAKDSAGNQGRFMAFLDPEINEFVAGYMKYD